MIHFFAVHGFTIGLACIAVGCIMHCLYLEKFPNFPASSIGWVGLAFFLFGVFGYVAEPAIGPISFLTHPIKQEPFQNYNKFIVFGILIITADLLRTLWHERRRQASQKT